MQKRLLLYCFLLLIFSFPAISLATSWMYDFVVWEEYVYEMTDEEVDNIDEEIGKVTKYSDMEEYEGNFSNKYKEGTKYFSIEGINTKKAIAVEVNEGEYKKAVRRSAYSGNNEEDNGVKIEYFVIILFTVMILTIIASILVTLFCSKKN